MYARGVIPLAICSLWLFGCARHDKPQESAVLTLKRDGSHFYGAVVRRDANSITVTGPSGDVHTFLVTDLSEMHFSKPGDKAAPPATPASAAVPATPTPLPAGASLFEKPQGTQFAVRSNGFLDSCCVRLNDIELGILDEDIKSPAGVVLIPQGANVTFSVIDQSTAGGRLAMTFELATADYGGHHYEITRGAVMTVTGEKNVKAYTGEAEPVGKPIHVENNAPLLFKASAPITFKLST